MAKLKLTHKTLSGQQCSCTSAKHLASTSAKHLASSINDERLTNSEVPMAAEPPDPGQSLRPGPPLSHHGSARSSSPSGLTKPVGTIIKGPLSPTVDGIWAGLVYLLCYSPGLQLAARLWAILDEL